MNLRQRYYVLDLYAKAMTIFWIPFLLIIMVLGLSMGWLLVNFAFGFLNAIVFTVVIGVPMVLFGQYAGAFLDQAEILLDLKEESPSSRH